MAKKRAEKDNADEFIRAAELRKFGEVLEAMGKTYALLADWLIKHGVAGLNGGGMPTARRGAGYLGSFAGSVLKAYLADASEVDSELLAGLASSEHRAKHLLQPLGIQPPTPLEDARVAVAEEEVIAKHLELTGDPASKPKPKPKRPASRRR